MRKILMSEKGEFKKQGKEDYVRATAVKMVAAVIKKAEREDDKDVVVSKEAMQRQSR